MKLHLRLQTDQKFNLMDENHLFQCMGLTRTNDAELNRIFPKEINNYLKNEMLVMSSSSNSAASSRLGSKANSPAQVNSDSENALNQMRSEKEAKPFCVGDSPDDVHSEKDIPQTQQHTPITKLVYDNLKHQEGLSSAFAQFRDERDSKVKNLSQPFMNTEYGTGHDSSNSSQHTVMTANDAILQAELGRVAKHHSVVAYCKAHPSQQ